MKKTKPKPKPKPKPTPKPNHLPFKIDERIISNQTHIIFKLMKGLFLEVIERSRELENEKKPNPNPNQHPNQITYHLKFDERIISNQTHIIFKLMKGLFLEVIERSRELENEKNQTQTQTNTQTKTPTF